MNQIKKRSLALLIVLALMLSLVFTANVSASTGDNSIVTVDDARNVAIDFIVGDMKTSNNADWKAGVGISKSTALFDLDNNPSAYLFELNDKLGNDSGYVMVSASKNENPIIEFAYTGKPFIDSAIDVTKADAEKNHIGKKVKKDKTKLYYLGDLTYLAEHELDDNTKQAYDISTGNYANINIDDVRQLKQNKSTDTQYLSMWNNSVKKHLIQSTGSCTAPDDGTIITNPSLYESGYKSSSSKDVPSYDRSYNIMTDFSTGKVCAPTAATNLCMYWLGVNYTKYSNLMDSTLGWQGTFNSFYTLMKTDKVNGGTSDGNVASAYVSYFSSKGLTCSASYTGTTYSGASIVTQINNNRPCHLMLHSHCVYGDHSVLALGYQKYTYADDTGWGQDTDSIYIRIADGWIRSATRYVWGSCEGWWGYVSVIPS
jgi:hypothetical protein